MTLRAKTKNRVVLLVAALVLLGGLAGGGYVLRNRQLDQRAVASRDEGLRLLEQGDHFNAMHKIGPYVRRNPEDVESLFRYAVARQNVPEPNRKHLSDAMSLYRRVLSLQPSHAEAADRLLDLYVENGALVEAVLLADRLLERDPAHGKALRTQVLALSSQREFVRAHEAATKLAGITPRDLETQQLFLQTLVPLDRSEERIRDHVEKLRQQYPGEVQFDVLQAAVLATFGDFEEAAQWLRQAASKPMPDAVTLRVLLDYCDGLELFEESFQLLQREAKAGRVMSEAQARLAQKLYELERFDALEGFPNPLESKANAQVLLLQNLALVQRGQNDRAQEHLGVLRELVESRESGMAREWLVVLEHLSAGSDGNDAALLQAARQAMENGQPGAQLHLILGDAYLALGDAEAAANAWRAAEVASPSWHQPRVRLGELALASGYPQHARDYARAALRRVPGDKASIRLLAQGTGALADPNDPVAVDEVLALCDQYEASSAGDLGLTPLRVRLLADAGRTEEAQKILQSTLAASPAASAEVLVALAHISRTRELEQEQALLDLCERVHGTGPALALARADALRRGGDVAAAVAFLDKAVAEAGDEAGRDLQIARAQFLEAVEHDRAREEWVKLSEAYPSEVRLQWMALNSRSARGDHAFVGRLLTRLEESIGNEGATWRTARARFLLDSNTSVENAGDAALILRGLVEEKPDHLQSRLLLATALHRVGNRDGTIQHLTAAAELSPGSATIPLELAKLLVERGSLLQAEQYVQRVLRSQSATNEERQAALQLAARYGDPATAIAALEQTGGAGNELLLASLYRRTHQHEKAEALSSRLLEKPDLQSIAFVTEFYQFLGRYEDAAAAMARLDDVEADPLSKHLLRGQFFMSTSDAPAALEQFQAATKLAPQDPRAWRELVKLQALQGEFEQLDRSLRDPAVSRIEDLPLRVARELAPLAAAAQPNWPEARLLYLGAIDEPGDRAAVQEMLRILGSTERSAIASELTRLVSLAGSRPRSLVMQLVVAEICLQAGRPDQAGSIVARAMEAFPDSGEAARLATLAFLEAGRFSEAAAAGTEWRRRQPREALMADIIIAEAHLRRGDLAAALRQTQSHDLQAISDPHERTPLAVQRSAMAIAMKRYDEAAGVLRPLIGQSQSALDAWVLQASSAIEDATVAAAWLSEADQLAGDHFNARLQMANAWQRLAERARDHPAIATAAAAAHDRLAQAVPLTPEDQRPTAWLILGMQSERRGTPDQAIAAYRRALELDRNLGVAANNLAMLLLGIGELDEALELAKRAVAAGGPHLPSFHDTLATVQERRGELQDAVVSARRAAELSPQSVLYKKHLAGLLISSGQQQEAATVLDELDRLQQADSRSNEQLRAELDELRARLH